MLLKCRGVERRADDMAERARKDSLASSDPSNSPRVFSRSDTCPKAKRTQQSPKLFPQSREHGIGTGREDRAPTLIVFSQKENSRIIRMQRICNVPTMKYTNLSGSVSSRFNRKVIRSANKRNAEHHRRSDDSDPSELSSDSGLGLDHQLEVQLATRTSVPYSTNTKVWPPDEPDLKRKKLNYHFEPDEVNDNFCFPDIVRAKSESDFGLYLSAKEKSSAMPGRGRGIAGTPATLSTPLTSTSRDGKAQLLIVCQPEQQHRARYQTEGSRGAVKDRTGNGFPVVKLAGYNKPTTLQIFIGTDVGRVTPHMFYQACRVSGKNSTPCVERKVDGTVVIEVDLDPSKDMVITCDCVGILKERNVDVEHRFPDQTGTRNKKKSTRCRMVFRAAITNNDGSTEILQVCSQPIVCTQPPGVPEICKKSLTSCPATGGAELFILGKNFLKDTKVIFQQPDVHPPWEETVLPDKEFLQQTHLICVVPPYRSADIIDPVTVKIFITSSGKASDPHTFVYLPAGSPIVPPVVDASPCSSYLHSSLPQAFVNGNRVFAKASNIPPILPSSAPLIKPSTMKPTYFDAIKKDVHSIPIIWPPPTKPDATHEEDKMMPPPPALIPVSRRPSVPLIIPDADPQLKTELIDDVSQHSVPDHDHDSLSPTDMQGVDLSMKAPLLRHLVDIPPATIASLPVDKYFPKPDAPKPYAVYDSDHDRRFLDEDLLRPPPPKIPALDFSDLPPFPRPPPSSSLIHPASPNPPFDPHPSQPPPDDSLPPSLPALPAPLPDPPNAPFDSYPRVRIPSLPPNYHHSAPFEPRPPALRVFDPDPPPIVLSNDCSIDNAMSSVVKQAVRDMESAFYCQATTPPTSSITQATSGSSALNSLVCPDLIAPTPNTRNLDEFVNRAADSHISPKPDPPHTSPSNDSFRPPYPIDAPSDAPKIEQPPLLPIPSNPPANPPNTSPDHPPPITAPPAPSSAPSDPPDPPPPPKDIAEPQIKPSAVPLTVKEISEGPQKIGDMIVPAGPPPPITGMVPQEMVKMTDSDLISYINPSCFDQGEKGSWSGPMSNLFF